MLSTRKSVPGRYVEGEFQHSRAQVSSKVSFSPFTTAHWVRQRTSYSFSTHSPLKRVEAQHARTVSLSGSNKQQKLRCCIVCNKHIKQWTTHLLMTVPPGTIKTFLRSFSLCCERSKPMVCLT
jgi:hypothetical protein